MASGSGKSSYPGQSTPKKSQANENSPVPVGGARRLDWDLEPIGSPQKAVVESPIQRQCIQRTAQGHYVGQGQEPGQGPGSGVSENLLKQLPPNIQAFVQTLNVTPIPMDEAVFRKRELLPYRLHLIDLPGPSVKDADGILRRFYAVVGVTEQEMEQLLVEQQQREGLLAQETERQLRQEIQKEELDDRLELQQQEEIREEEQKLIQQQQQMQEVELRTQPLLPHPKTQIFHKTLLQNIPFLNGAIIQMENALKYSSILDVNAIQLNGQLNSVGHKLVRLPLPEGRNNAGYPLRYYGIEELSDAQRELINQQELLPPYLAASALQNSRELNAQMNDIENQLRAAPILDMSAFRLNRELNAAGQRLYLLPRPEQENEVGLQVRFYSVRNEPTLATTAKGCAGPETISPPQPLPQSRQQSEIPSSAPAPPRLPIPVPSKAPPPSALPPSSNLKNVQNQHLELQPMPPQQKTTIFHKALLDNLPVLNAAVGQFEGALKNTPIPDVNAVVLNGQLNSVKRKLYKLEAMPQRQNDQGFPLCFYGIQEMSPSQQQAIEQEERVQPYISDSAQKDAQALEARLLELDSQLQGAPIIDFKAFSLNKELNAVGQRLYLSSRPDQVNEAGLQVRYYRVYNAPTPPSGSCGGGPTVPKQLSPKPQPELATERLQPQPLPLQLEKNFTQKSLLKNLPFLNDLVSRMETSLKNSAIIDGYAVRLNGQLNSLGRRLVRLSNVERQNTGGGSQLNYYSIKDLSPQQQELIDQQENGPPYLADDVRSNEERLRTRINELNVELEKAPMIDFNAFRLNRELYPVGYRLFLLPRAEQENNVGLQERYYRIQSSQMGDSAGQGQGQGQPGQQVIPNPVSAKPSQIPPPVFSSKQPAKAPAPDKQQQPQLQLKLLPLPPHPATTIFQKSLLQNACLLNTLLKEVEDKLKYSSILDVNAVILNGQLNSVLRKLSQLPRTEEVNNAGYTLRYYGIEKMSPEQKQFIDTSEQALPYFPPTTVSIPDLLNSRISELNSQLQKSPIIDFNAFRLNQELTAIGNGWRMYLVPSPRTDTEPTNRVGLQVRYYQIQTANGKESESGQQVRAPAPSTSRAANPPPKFKPGISKTSILAPPPPPPALSRPSLQKLTKGPTVDQPLPPQGKIIFQKSLLQNLSLLGTLIGQMENKLKYSSILDVNAILLNGQLNSVKKKLTRLPRAEERNTAGYPLRYYAIQEMSEEQWKHVKNSDEQPPYFSGNVCQTPSLCQQRVTELNKELQKAPIIDFDAYRLNAELSSRVMRMFLLPKAAGENSVGLDVRYYRIQNPKQSGLVQNIENRRGNSCDVCIESAAGPSQISAPRSPAPAPACVSMSMSAKFKISERDRKRASVTNEGGASIFSEVPVPLLSTHQSPALALAPEPAPVPVPVPAIGAILVLKIAKNNCSAVPVTNTDTTSVCGVLPVSTPADISNCGCTHDLQCICPSCSPKQL